MSHNNGPNEGNWSVFAAKVVEERDALKEELAQVRTERNKLHGVVRACLWALDNGSGASEHASLGFLTGAPSEVAAEIKYLREENRKLTEVIDKMRTSAVEVRPTNE